MARSTYIYVAQDAAWGGVVKAAFTVKHELVAWLHRDSGTAMRLRVFRVPDGGSGYSEGREVVELEVRELLA